MCLKCTRRRSSMVRSITGIACLSTSLANMCMHHNSWRLGSLVNSLTKQCVTSRLLSSKEVQKVPVSGSEDLLLQSLKSTTNTQNVLQIVETHHSIMNNTHLLQALRSLFVLQKRRRSDLDKEAIIGRPEFEMLCHNLKKRSRFIELNDTIDALKMVTYLGVPSSSALVQVLLQHVRLSVNDLSLEQIVFLDFLLDKFNHSPLVEALKIALPMVFEAQLSMKLDRDDKHHLATMLNFACKKRVSDVCLEQLVKALSLHGEDFDLYTAKSAVWSLCTVRKTQPSHQTLLETSLNAITESIKECTYEDMEMTLGRLVRKYTHNHDFFYNEHFTDCVARYVVDNDSGFVNGIFVLKKLLKMNHVNIPLLDYLGMKVCENHTLLERCRPGVLFTLIAALSNANYKPACWSNIIDAVLNNNIFQMEKVELPWIQFALNLASLGYFSASLLERLFSEDFLKQFLSREKNFLDHVQLLNLYQTVVCLYPSYSGPFPPEEVIQEAIKCSMRNPQVFPLQGALECGLGGPSYVQTKLYTKLGQFADHAVVMRKGGYPVAVNQDLTGDNTGCLLEDMKIPPDSQILLVLVLRPGWFSRNCHRLRGTFSLQVENLEALGYLVLPVTYTEWSSLPDHEKIPYLMQNLKLKCEGHLQEIGAS